MLGGNPERQRATDGARPQICLESTQIFDEPTNHTWVGRTPGVLEKNQQLKDGRTERRFQLLKKAYLQEGQGSSPAKLNTSKGNTAEPRNPTT